MRKVSDIVRNQNPVSLPPSATVREACQSMRDSRVGAVLVTDPIAASSAFSRGVTPFIACLLRGRAPRKRYWPKS
jgi:hypothetical protein